MTIALQDLIQARFGVAYHPHYLTALLHNLGFSSQKVRLVSDHLHEAKGLEWRQTQWPRIVRQKQQRKALLLFGDEASFAQWGSLSYTWAPTGEQPDVRTSDKRKGYKVFGLIDSFSGQFFYKAHEGRFHSESYAAFLLGVLSHTRRHVVVIQDGARYHTSEEGKTAHVALQRLPHHSLEPDFDYFGFEERFRGSEQDIKERQRVYLQYFQGQENILDIGCGRGEFLELLRKAGIKALGVDTDLDMVLYCREK